MASKVSLSAGDSVPIILSKGISGTVMVATSADTPADAVIEVQFEGYPGEFLRVGLWDPTTQDFVANLTGPNKTGWVDAPAYSDAIVKRTDANGGVANIGYNTLPG